MERDAVLRFLREHARGPARVKDIARGLRVKSSDYGELRRTLREMEAAGEVYRARNRRYALPERINLGVGRLQITRAGHGFVVLDAGGEDVFVPASRLADAYAGDRVAVRVERQRRGRNPEGAVVRVLERARSRVVGVFHRSAGFGYLVPSEGTLHRDVFVPGRRAGGARDGEVAVAQIVDWGSGHLDPVGEIVEVLGQPGEPGVDVLAIVHAHELPLEFPAEVTAQAAALDTSGPESAELAGRKRLPRPARLHNRS